jgi:hypothetical protein
MKQSATTAVSHSNHINNVQNEHSIAAAISPVAIHTSSLLQCRAPSSSATDNSQPTISDSTTAAAMSNRTDGVVISKLLQSIKAKDVQSTALIQQLQHSDSIIRRELERREADVLQLKSVMNDRAADMNALMQLLAVDDSTDSCAAVAQCNVGAADTTAHIDLSSLRAVASSSNTDAGSTAADSDTIAIVIPEQCSNNVTVATASEVPHTLMAISAAAHHSKSVTFNVNNSDASSSVQQQQQQQQYDQTVHADNSSAAVANDHKHRYTRSDGNYLNDAHSTTAATSNTISPMLARYDSIATAYANDSSVAANSIHQYNASKIWRRADLHEDSAMTRCSSWQGSRPIYNTNTTQSTTAATTLNDVATQQHNSTDMAPCTGVTPATTDATIPWTRRRSKSLGRIHNNNNNSSLADLHLYQFLATSKR